MKVSGEGFLTRAIIVLEAELWKAKNVGFFLITFVEINLQNV